MTARLIDDVTKLRLEVDVDENPPEELEIQWGTRVLQWKKWKVTKGKVVYKPKEGKV